MSSELLRRSEAMPAPKTLAEHPDYALLLKMLDSVNAHNDACLNWPRTLSVQKYGLIWLNRNSINVHRLAYELKVEKIPAGRHLKHTCGNPWCFRPSHLYIQTDEYEKLRQMLNK